MSWLRSQSTRVFGQKHLWKEVSEFMERPESQRNSALQEAYLSYEDNNQKLKEEMEKLELEALELVSN